MAKRSPLNSNSRLFESLTDSLGKPVQQGSLSREFIGYLNQFSTQSETQTDGVNAAGNPPTGVEFNALVAIVNALIDKLQVAGLME